MTDNTQLIAAAKQILTQFLVSQGLEQSKAEAEANDQISRTPTNLLKRILSGRVK